MMLRAQSTTPKLALPTHASQAPCTSLAYYDATPLVKGQTKAAKAGFEPETLRLLAVCTNHWAKLTLTWVWKLEILKEKQTTVARPFQKNGAGGLEAVFFGRWMISAVVKH